MEPGIILALIVNLYEQLLKVQQENVKLQEALTELQKSEPAP